MIISTRELDTIDVIGVNGDFCRISPPGLSWGPELAPGSSGLFEMPIQTNYGTYAYGQFFQSWKPKRRDIVWTANILNPETHTPLDEDSALWHLIYSRWKAMFSPKHEATIVYTSHDGERTLKVRTLDTPKPFSTWNFEGGDPKQWVAGSVVQTMAAELPFYVGRPDRFEWESSGPGSFCFPMPYFNPSTIDVFAEWDLSWGARYQLPDYSFGNEIHGRGLVDLGKTVLTGLGPFLEADGNVTAFCRPDLETYISENETPVGNRSAGKDFEYPIPPGEGDPDEGCMVRVIGATDVVSVILTLPRWYAEPFSAPLVV